MENKTKKIIGIVAVFVFLFISSYVAFSLYKSNETKKQVLEYNAQKKPLQIKTVELINNFVEHENQELKIKNSGVVDNTIRRVNGKILGTSEKFIYIESADKVDTQIFFAPNVVIENKDNSQMMSSELMSDMGISADVDSRNNAIKININ